MSVAFAALPLITLITCFVFGGLFLRTSSELLVLALLAAATVAGLQAIRRGATWDEIQRSTGEKLAAVLPVILILLAIGMLIGTWVASGTIPTLIAGGIGILSPRFFVLSAFLVTAVMSLCTGTSWGSAGTLGVALMGAASVIGVPLPATAGAVISGAYLGDKMSPLSDSTNICAIGAAADLYAHIRNMLYTAVPSTLIALIIYTIVGLRTAAATSIPDSAVRLLAEMETVFTLSPWTLLPLGVVLAGIVLRVSPALALATSSFVATVLAIVLQGFRIESAMASAVIGFKPIMVAELGLDPGNLSASFVSLLDRGGLYSMSSILVFILAAFLLAAGMDVSGALDRLLEFLLTRVKSTFGLIAATMASGATMISLTSHGGVTALIVGGMFQKAYKERDLAPVNLSRSLEDSVTIVEPLMPWTVSGIFMATTLGVATLDLIPWAVFCYCGPIFSLAWAAGFDNTGVGLKRLDES